MSAVVESAGTALLKALLNEVRQLPKPWQQTPEKEQEVVIDRLRRSVESAVRATVKVMFAGEFPRIPATVDSVTFKDGVKASLTLVKGQAGTHQLADAQGGQVLVVIASEKEFLDGMERVKAESDQREMFPDADPDDRWQKIADAIGQGESTSEATAEGDEPTEPKSMGAQTRELLLNVFVDVPLETCEAWTERECTVAAFWAIEYAKNPETAPARPHWLPLPQPPSSETPTETAAAATEGETAAGEPTGTDDGDGEKTNEPDDNGDDEPEDGGNEGDEP